jgi:hypothetical protein
MTYYPEVRRSPVSGPVKKPIVPFSNAISPQVDRYRLKTGRRGISKMVQTAHNNMVGEAEV